MSRGLVFVIVLLFGMSGCSSAEDFWGPIRVSGSEAESFASLDEMAQSADVVAAGRFTSVEMGRSIEGDGTGDSIFYVLVTFVPTQVAQNRTDAKSTSYPVEFLLGAPTKESARSAIADMKRSLPKDEVVVYLRQKKGSESHVYRLVNTTGLWIDSGAAVDAPLAEELESPEPPYARDVEGIDDVKELLSPDR